MTKVKKTNKYSFCDFISDDDNHDNIAKEEKKKKNDKATVEAIQNLTEIISKGFSDINLTNKVIMEKIESKKSHNMSSTLEEDEDQDIMETTAKGKMRKLNQDQKRLSSFRQNVSEKLEQMYKEKANSNETDDDDDDEEEETIEEIYIEKIENVKKNTKIKENLKKKKKRRQ